MSENKGKNDAGEIREILDAVSDKVPRLIKELMGSLYSKDAGTNMGQSVGAFYKELVESGIPAADALGMAKVYLFSLKDVMKQQINPKKSSWHVDLGKSSDDDVE